MKLVVAIVSEQIAAGLSEELLKHGIRMTSLTSSGGFLKQGNRTIISGVEDDEAQLVLQIIKEYTQKKKLQKIQSEKADARSIVEEGLATVFIIPVEEALRY